MFGLSRRQHHHDAGTESYAETLAHWQISHGTDRHDLTPDQAGRLRIHHLALNAGIEIARVAFVRVLVESGRVGEGAV